MAASLAHLVSVFSLEFFVRSDIFQASPHPEDSSPREGIAFYVVAEGPDGRRWAHKHSWVRQPCDACDYDEGSDEFVVCAKHRRNPSADYYTNEEAEAG